MTPEQQRTLDTFPKVMDWLLRSDGKLFVHVPGEGYNHGLVFTFIVEPDGKSYRSDW